jgi:malonyl CoA-acyl carrier protein transacylase
MADFAAIDRSRYEIVGVAGNSMGWYTALAAAGALSLSDAIRLVDTMGAYQEGHVIGGQLLYPLSDATGALDPALKDAVTAALRAANAVGYAGVSIDLGNTLVLAGDEAGLKALTEALPKLERGARTFPVRLPLHSAFHTPLLAETAARAQVDLADLDFRAPDVTLVDGRGRNFRPRWADPAELAAYTLGAQVTETYGFARSIQVALHHTGPDVVIALGPGNPLGGPLAWMLVHEGWNGVRDRAAFAARQAGEAPLLLSTGVPEQRARLW